MTDETTPETSETDPASEPTGEMSTATEEKPKKLKQAVEFKDIGPCKKHIKVTIERDDIDAKLNEKYSELVTDANVPGFRPGKAPRKIIERRFSKDVVDQVRGELILQSLEQLAEDHDVAPLSPPDLNPAKIEIPKEGPLTYEFEVEVRPEFDLPNYKGLKLKRPIKKFSDADVEREEKRLLEPYGQIVPKEPAVAAEGDLLVADLTVKDGDKVLRELKESRIRVQPKLAFQDGVAEKFGEQVKGAKPGDTRVVDIKLSEMINDEAIRGKTVQATFAIQDVKTVRMPEITHELCHQFGVHSEAQLKELIRVALDRRLEYQQRQSARQQVLEHIAAAATWELPNDLLVRQARKAMGRRVMDMRSAGISEDEIRARQRLLQQQSLQTTALELKEHFVLQKLAEVEKIDINEDDIEAEIERIADRSNEPPRRIRARLEREDLMDALAAEVIERKALDLILEHAEWTEVPLTETDADRPVATVEAEAVPGSMEEPAKPSEEGGES